MSSKHTWLKSYVCEAMPFGIFFLVCVANVSVASGITSDDIYSDDIYNVGSAPKLVQRSMTSNECSPILNFYEDVNVYGAPFVLRPSVQDGFIFACEYKDGEVNKYKIVLEVPKLDSSQTKNHAWQEFFDCEKLIEFDLSKPGGLWVDLDVVRNAELFRERDGEILNASELGVSDQSERLTLIEISNGGYTNFYCINSEWYSAGGH